MFCNDDLVVNMAQHCTSKCAHCMNLSKLFLFQAVLGVIVCMGLFGMFKQFKDIVRYFRLSFADLVSATVCVIFLLQLV